MRDFLLYCAGPILGCSYQECTDWREYVASKLPTHIKAVSPMRGKEYLADEKAVGSQYEKFPLSTAKAITCRDRNDVMSCDAILVNLRGAKRVSVGSMIEVGWADAYRKPIILVMKKDEIHDHPIVRETAGFIVSDLDEAIKVAIAVLSPTL